MAVATSTNGSKPKLELALNESVRLKLLKDKCYEGMNGYGAFFLYSVEHDGTEKAFFATTEIHNAIVSAKLKTGDEFILRKTAVQTGKRLTPQISIEFVERLQTTATPDHHIPDPVDGALTHDNLKEILLQCVKDAAEVIRNSGIQMGNDELQKLATTLFITRSKNAT